MTCGRGLAVESDRRGENDRQGKTKLLGGDGGQEKVIRKENWQHAKFSSFTKTKRGKMRQERSEIYTAKIHKKHYGLVEQSIRYRGIAN